jgi:hypothetical protein
MKIYESENDQYGSFIMGLAYTGILAIILLLCCLVINEKWFDYSLTYILVALICIAFFISGLKNVKQKNLGFLIKLGKRHFEEYFSEGIWWVFPLWKFQQQPHFDILNESEELEVKYITNDEIPIDINIKYYWQLKDPKDKDNRYTTSFIKDTLKHELGIFVRNRPAIELLSDESISNKVLVNYLINAGNKIGILISDVFPNINYENQFIPVVRKYQEKYKDLKFQLDELLMHQKIKASDMKLYENQIVNCIKNLGFTSNESMSFIKVYKNQVNMNESTYNIGELNNILESVISFFKK